MDRDGVNSIPICSLPEHTGVLTAAGLKRLCGLRISRCMSRRGISIRQECGGTNNRIEKIVDGIRTVKLPDGNHVTCSVGCVRVTEGQSFKSVSKRADDALYEAKKNGRDRICTVE